MRRLIVLVILLSPCFVACGGNVAPTPTSPALSTMVSLSPTASIKPTPAPSGIDNTDIPLPSGTAPAATPTESPVATLSGGSGIEGVALAGPQCPVEQQGSPCSDKPVANVTINVHTADRLTTVASVQTDGDGHFIVALSPGDYYLDPQSPDPSIPYPIGKPQTVTVRAGEWTQVIISYDTGIR